MAETIWTIGHSTRPIDEFTGILNAFEIGQLIDIRTIPKSRHNPQFHEDVLPGSLADAGIRYLRLADLGGLRGGRGESVNTGWRNASFRRYADYMQTDAFASGIAELVALGSAAKTAIMCAEAVPWRCHRSLVGDALLVRGVEVLDIFSATSAKPHTLTSFAKVDGTRITYPGDGETPG